MKTTEGYTYTVKDGLLRGLETDAVVDPKASGKATGKLYDAIVIGAGFAGLTAARDLSLLGHSVLLVEARDRLGGRTWTANVGGESWEMGGTWIHWQQGFVWRELKRYGIDRDLKYTPDAQHPSKAYSTANLNGKTYKLSGEQLKILDDAYFKFCDVDGQGAASVVPIPTAVISSILSDPEVVKKYDAMTVADRVAEVREQKILTEDQLAFLLPFFAVASGTSVEKASLLEALKWFVHANRSFSSVLEMCTGFKIARGTTHLANLIFREAQQSGNMAWAFEEPVVAIVDDGYAVKVSTKLGTYRSKAVVCTLPLNVASSVHITPPLPAGKVEAFRIGHVHRGDKIHFELSDPAYRSWSGNQYNEKERTTLVMAHGDQSFTSGHSTVVAYSYDAGTDQHEAPSLIADRLQERLAAFEPGLEAKVTRSVFHEWYTDPYALGGWSMAPKNWTTAYLHECQARHGRIFWASADWADGWKGFIDGAIEQGTRSAYQVKEELRGSHQGRARL